MQKLKNSPNDMISYHFIFLDIIRVGQHAQPKGFPLVKLTLQKILKNDAKT